MTNLVHSSWGEPAKSKKTRFALLDLLNLDCILRDIKVSVFTSFFHLHLQSFEILNLIWHSDCFVQGQRLTVDNKTHGLGVLQMVRVTKHEESKMIMRWLTNHVRCLNRHSPRLSSKGFTLIELIVILAVISILVAILTPTVLKYIAEAQVDRAQSDVNTISTMLNDLIKDTGQYPGNFLFTRTFICGPGTQPTAPVVWCSAANSRQLSNHLILNDPDESGTTTAADYRSSGKFRWKGPYITSLNEDPWGNAYAINASTLTGSDTNPTWVISAGPDGVFQTALTATTLAGDDIGVRIK